MYTAVNAIVGVLKKILPNTLVDVFRPLYHRGLSFFMALAYGFPAKKLVVIGVTGTKGKSTVAEMLFTIFRAKGYKTALLSTIRFAIEDHSEPNRYKMTLPGRGFAQAFMRRALAAGCTHFIIEVTSESVLQYRHLYLELDALAVTNIQKEHIERHGSFENYAAAKREIVMALAHSKKQSGVLVSNADIAETAAFLTLPVKKAIGFRAEELEHVSTDERSVHFTFDTTKVSLPLPGVHNALNALAALKLAQALGVEVAKAAEALSTLPPVHGRTEHIDAGQEFFVVVDYAHTPDSLTALYQAFPKNKKICVLGNTGGGRDIWKRPVMGKIAEEHCEKIILTNEDPYDEDPYAIMEEMAKGMSPGGRVRTKIIPDRREAIRSAIEAAQKGDAVLISGKGTDPFIMGPDGTKEPWNDAYVTREELEKHLGQAQHQI